MELSVSNLAWEADDDQRAVDLLKHFGVGHLDLVPGRYFKKPWQEPISNWKELQFHWEKMGMKFAGMQSLLYGFGEASLFGSREDQEGLKNALLAIFVRAKAVGISRLVLGSPKNRLVPIGFGSPNPHAVSFFSELACDAEALGIELLLEPNSRRHGCNFVNTTQAAIEIASAVASPSFGVNFDLGAELDSPSFDSVSPSDFKFLRHSHVSSPDLGVIKGLAEPEARMFNSASLGGAEFIVLEQLASGKSSMRNLEESLETVTAWAKGNL